MALVDRAARAGFDTLLVTVDVPVAGARLRDIRNGMTIPPTLTPRTVLNAIPRPAWWFNFLTTEPLAFASPRPRGAGTVAELLDTMFDPTVTYEDLAWIRDQWPGQGRRQGSPDPRRRAPAGRRRGRRDHPVQPRRPPARPRPDPVPPAAARWCARSAATSRSTSTPGSCPAPDIVAAVALGARFTLVGRAYLYGLMAGGRDGVDRAIEILPGQIGAPCGCSGSRRSRSSNPGTSAR